MEYTNYLTTPSGKFCEVKDISNEQYFLLLRFVQSENFEKFYQYLNEIAISNIPNFDEFDVVDKCYVFIAMCMYSVRSSISVKNDKIGSQEIQLVQILNNIEESYPRNRTCECKVNDKITLTFSLPTDFFFENNTPIIDSFSGLKQMNGVNVTKEMATKIKQKLNTKQLCSIDETVRNAFNVNFDFFSGIPFNNRVFNLVSETLIMDVIAFYKTPLEVFYQTMYAVIRHLRMSYSDFMKISNVETNILIGIAVEENKKTEEKMKGNG